MRIVAIISILAVVTIFPSHAVVGGQSNPFALGCLSGILAGVTHSPTYQEPGGQKEIIVYDDDYPEECYKYPSDRERHVCAQAWWRGQEKARQQRERKIYEESYRKGTESVPLYGH
jgi:hypothetical protein